MVVKFLNAFFLKSRRKNGKSWEGGKVVDGGKKFHVGRDSLLPIPPCLRYNENNDVCVFVLVDKRED